MFQKKVNLNLNLERIFLLLPNYILLKTISIRINLIMPSTLKSKIYFTKGLATSLRDTLLDMTSSTGAINKAQNALTAEMSDIDKNIAAFAERLQAQEDKLYTQFSAMEAQLAKLQRQGDYLTQQITAMTNTSNK